MHVITVANQKGGVGKTTSTLALCAGFAQKGFRVLGIDLDPQGNFTKTAAIQNDENVYTAYSVLKIDCLLCDAIQTSEHGFDAVPSGKTLAFVEGEISSQLNKHYRLREQLASIEGMYDYVFIDVPPSLGLYTLNALTASNELLIPSLADSYALEGIIELYKTVGDVRKYNANPDLQILGIVLTMYDPRPSITKVSEMMAETISEKIKAPIFDTKIRVNVAVKSAQVYQESIFSFKKTSNAAVDYENLVEEIIKREKELQKGTEN